MSPDVEAIHKNLKIIEERRRFYLGLDPYIDNSTNKKLIKKAYGYSEEDLWGDDLIKVNTEGEVKLHNSLFEE